MALFFKRLALTAGLAGCIFVGVAAILWAGGYFIRFTRIGEEPRIVLTMGAAPWGLILFLVIVVAAWLSTWMLPGERAAAAEEEEEKPRPTRAA